MTAVAQVLALARRSVLGTWRQLPLLIPSVVFPLLLAAVNSSAFSRSTALPGFPEVDSFLDFLLPASIIQGVLFGATNSGSDVALDIETGFFDRLIASPVWRPSLLVGRLMGGAVLGAAQAAFFIAVYLVFGATVKAGVAGVLMLLLVAIVLGVGLGGVTGALGVRSGSQEAVQNMFPLVFILLFLSSAFFPTELMSGWYQTAAKLNPLTSIIDGMRHLVTVGWSWREAGRALGVSAAFAVATVSLAAWQLRRRLVAA